LACAGAATGEGEKEGGVECAECSLAHDNLPSAAGMAGLVAVWLLAVLVAHSHNGSSASKNAKFVEEDQRHDIRYDAVGSIAKTAFPALVQRPRPCPCPLEALIAVTFFFFSAADAPMFRGIGAERRERWGCEQPLGHSKVLRAQHSTAQHSTARLSTAQLPPLPAVAHLQNHVRAWETEDATVQRQDAALEAPRAACAL
jgi:hypothetical protein